MIVLRSSAAPKCQHLARGRRRIDTPKAKTIKGDKFEIMVQYNSEHLNQTLLINDVFSNI